MSDFLPVQPAATPTSTPDAIAGCQDQTAAYLASLQPTLDEWQDTLELASTTPRLTLSTLVQDMQRMQRQISSVPVPGCAQATAARLMMGVDCIIQGFIDFMRELPDSFVEREIQQGLMEMQNAQDQLHDLATGQPTRTPRTAPLVTNNWEIQVERVQTVEVLTSPSRDHLQPLHSHFTLVFVSVTNTVSSPDRSVSYSWFWVSDSLGNQYEPHSAASDAARSVFGTDELARFGPYESRHLALAFDLPASTSWYALHASTSGYPFSDFLLLNMP